MNFDDIVIGKKYLVARLPDEETRYTKSWVGGMNKAVGKVGTVRAVTVPLQSVYFEESFFDNCFYPVEVLEEVITEKYKEDNDLGLIL